MERRLLSAFLAVMMVLTMAPVAFAADTSVDSYDSLVEAINSASDGDTITLNGDIDVQRTLVVTKKLTLDLAGHKLYNTKDLWDAPTEKDNNWSLISVRENGDLTITGNGTLDAKKDDCYAVDVQDETAKATLENGTFVGNITTVYVFEGTLVVKDGSYSIKQLNSNGVQNQYGLTINCYDQNYKNGTAKVLITGGTFAHFNPVDNAAEGTGTNFATSGYETVEGTDGLYTAQVKSDNAAAIDDVQYATLADAVAAANNGDTVTLLKNTVEDVVIPAGKTITLDLNGKKLTNICDNTITNHGKIEIIDKTGKGVVDNITNAKTAITNDGTVVLRGGTYTRSQEAGKDKDNGGGNSYYTILNDNGGSLTIYDGVTVYNKGHFSSMIRNGGTAGAESKLYINGGTFSGGINTVKNDESGYLNISGGDFSNTTQFVVMNWHKAEISGDATFAVNDTAEAVLFTSSYGGAATTKGELTISGGYFKTATDTQDMIRDAYDANNKGTAYVSGGYFNKRFSGDFCATGLTVIDNDDKIYKYTVGTVEVKDENEIKTGTQEGDTQADVSAIAADKQDAAREVGKSVTPTKLADTTPITPDDKAQALTELVKKNKVTLDTNGKIPENTTVTVVKETYLDVTVTGYDTANSTVSMDIAPKYNLIAVAKTGDNQTAQVTLKSAQDAKVGSTEVEVTLPEAFKGKKVYINHNNGANLYVATADKTTGKVKFTTNGFSPFTFALTNPDVVAEVNGNAYKSLKEAIDVAQTGATIVLQKDCTEKVTVAGKSLTINRNGKTFNEANVKVGSNCTKEVKNDTIVVTYTKPSSGSSGGSSSGKTTYKVTTSAVNNGGVNASPSNAEKGATITITLSPDKGYKLDKLTVTDGSGKTVSTVKKSDTVYTFTMPASAVKVGVSYVKATETPSETKFNDVSANDWFASAVDYVTGKGMMNGTADNTFSPKANTTRGMVVTVLYRLENQPSTSAASFTDVASGAYYANAVAWANANGIVSGYGSGKFGPNDKVTREQLAAILYRYAQYKKYDVSVGEDTNILSYDDAQSISSYAIPAIQWACGAGVVTGKSGSKLDPKGNATRAEVAAMLMRFCENVK